MARIVASLTELPSVSFSPPGLELSHRKYSVREPDGALHRLSNDHGALHHRSVAVVVENDWISHVDNQVNQTTKSHTSDVSPHLFGLTNPPPTCIPTYHVCFPLGASLLSRWAWYSVSSVTWPPKRTRWLVILSRAPSATCWSIAGMAGEGSVAVPMSSTWLL